jgi:hypothetical protein
VIGKGLLHIETFYDLVQGSVFGTHLISFRTASVIVRPQENKVSVIIGPPPIWKFQKNFVNNSKRQSLKLLKKHVPEYICINKNRALKTYVVNKGVYCYVKNKYKLMVLYRSIGNKYDSPNLCLSSLSSQYMLFPPFDASSSLLPHIIVHIHLFRVSLNTTMMDV